MDLAKEKRAIQYLQTFEPDTEPYGNITFRVVPIDEIDQIAKEMLEEDQCLT